MRKTHYVFGVVIVFGVMGIGYGRLQAKFSAEPEVIANFADCVRAGYPILESYPAQCRTRNGKVFVEPIDMEIQANGEGVRVTGQISCLPKIGRGVQTMECVIGLKGDDGKYYGLQNLFEHDLQYQFSSDGMRVEVEGNLIPGKMKAPDGNDYDVAGAIQVEAIREEGFGGLDSGDDFGEEVELWSGSVGNPEN